MLTMQRWRGKDKDDILFFAFSLRKKKETANKTEWGMNNNERDLMRDCVGCSLLICAQSVGMRRNEEKRRAILSLSLK